jgi:hypothetical protein
MTLVQTFCIAALICSDIRVITCSSCESRVSVGGRVAPGGHSILGILLARRRQKSRRGDESCQNFLLRVPLFTLSIRLVSPTFAYFRLVSA